MAPSKIFVYGTLLRGLENSPLLKDSTFCYSGVSLDEVYYLISNLSHEFNLKRKGQDEARSAAYNPTDYEPQDAYAYPFMMKKPVVDGHLCGVVHGEVYEVSEEQLERLDLLEDHPRSYRRTPIRIQRTTTITTTSSRSSSGSSSDSAEGGTTTEGEAVRDVDTDVEVYLLHSEEQFEEISASVAASTGQYELLTAEHGGSWKTYLECREKEKAMAKASASA